MKSLQKRIWCFTKPRKIWSKIWSFKNPKKVIRWVVDRLDYIKKEHFTQNKFSKINLKDHSLRVNKDKRVDKNVIKFFESNILTEDILKPLIYVESRPGFLYDICRDRTKHRRLPPLFVNFIAFEIPTYKLWNS